MHRTGIETYWGSPEKTFIQIDYGSDWDWPEFWASDSIVREMLDTSTVPIDLILNLEEAEIPSTTLTELPRIARSAAGATHARVRHIFLVGTGTYLRTAWDLFQRLFPDIANRIIVCNTLTDAYSHPDMPPQSQ
jgi:hypothetical protein